MFLLLLQIPQLLADNADSSSGKTKKFSVLPVPAFGYSPETKTYVGAVCLFTFRLGDPSNTRASNAKVEFNYTQRKQFIYEIGWNIFSKNERNFYQGKLHFSKFPDYFWGTGSFVPEKDKVQYSANRMFAECLGFHLIKKKWYIGASIRYIKYSNVNFLSGDFWTYRVLKFHEAVGFPGIALLRDTRDNILLTTKGMYLFTHVTNMYKPKDNYNYMVLDFRKYNTRWKIFTNSFQFKTVYSNCSNAFDMAAFGGDVTARGYYAGRYRSSLFLTLQKETKIRIYKRWAIAFFGGASFIGEANPSLSQYDLYDIFEIVGNVGSGIRFLIDRKENVNLRLDYAWGMNGNSGFYVAFGEAF